MLENFQLAVITKQGTETNLLSIPLYQDLQDDLTENWQDQYRRFVFGIQEIDFNAGYNPEEHECFLFKRLHSATLDCIRRQSDNSES